MKRLFHASSLLCLAALAGPAAAADVALVVNNAYAEGGVLFIEGGNFGTLPPYVTLAGVPLVVLSSNRTEIQAQMLELRSVVQHHGRVASWMEC